MDFDPRSLGELERHVRATAAAEGPSDVFRVLLDGARLAAPRASIYLVRQAQIRGWGAVGFPQEAAQRLRRHAAPLDEGWLGRAAASEPGLREQTADGLCPDFGQPGAAECLGMAVRVKGRPIALLVAERAVNETPWAPPALGILVQTAEMRLALDLLRRKLSRGETRAAEPAPSEAPREAVARSPEPVPQIEVIPVDLAPEEPGGAAQGAEADAARRYARVVATDIRLYNEDAVLQGRRNGDLVERLGEHLARGKQTFLRRYGGLGPSAVEILHDAYVQVLAGGDQALLPASKLD